MTFFRQPLGVLQQLLLSLSSKSIIPPFHLQLLQQQSQGRIRLLRISSNAFSSDGRREVGDKQPEIPESTPSSTTASAPSSPTPAKKQVVSFNENDLEEKFQKGGGPGGQKINKSSSAVVLKHLPTGIIIQTQRFRDLSSNRKEARKLLILKLDEIENGDLSKRGQKIKKAQELKRRKEQRSRKKYGGNGGVKGGEIKDEES